MDLTTAQTKLAAVTAAYEDALGAYSEGIGDMTIVHQRLEILRGEMAYWQRVVDTLTAKAIAGDSGVALGVATARWS